MNPAMPLIRYRTGDLADLVRAEDGFFLTNVCGRVHDVIRIGHSRYPTHYVQDLLDRIGGIDEFQVEERPDAPVTLRLAVKDPSRQGEIERRVKQPLAGRPSDRVRGPWAIPARRPARQVQICGAAGFLIERSSMRWDCP